MSVADQVGHKGHTPPVADPEGAGPGARPPLRSRRLPPAIAVQAALHPLRSRAPYCGPGRAWFLLIAVPGFRAPTYSHLLRIQGSYSEPMLVWCWNTAASGSGHLWI